MERQNPHRGYFTREVDNYNFIFFVKVYLEEVKNLQREKMKVFRKNIKKIKREVHERPWEVERGEIKKALQIKGIEEISEVIFQLLEKIQGEIKELIEYWREIETKAVDEEFYIEIFMKSKVENVFTDLKQRILKMMERLRELIKTPEEIIQEEETLFYLVLNLGRHNSLLEILSKTFSLVSSLEASYKTIWELREDLEILTFLFLEELQNSKNEEESDYQAISSIIELLASPYFPLPVAAYFLYCLD